MRDRQSHGDKLRREIEQAAERSRDLGLERETLGVSVDAGVCLQFKSDPGFPLKLDSLENLKSGIQLLSTHEIDGTTVAAVFVPEGKLAIFLSRLEQYLAEETAKGAPKNQGLVDSVAEIQVAALDAFWTDTRDSMPGSGQSAWWEVWLRNRQNGEPLVGVFASEAARLGIRVGAEKIEFPDRVVVLAHSTKEELAKSAQLLNCIAEVRRAKENPKTFLEMGAVEQEEWVRDARERTSPAPPGSPAVCLLDTGVNRGHPLLEDNLALADMHSYEPSWGVGDHIGHGTEMAGVALYGDLVDLLVSGGRVSLPHELESVKILPPHGGNDPRLYGEITRESIARAEISAPLRSRAICMAVTAPDFRDRGKPSSWSAAIDKLTSGADDDSRRLLVAAAGNTEPHERHNYPDSNHTDAVHDPGQSWNALTIGAYTEKTSIDGSAYPEWVAVAPEGGLSPSSCTSTSWSGSWPLKPDVVMEGGNMAVNPATGTADYVDSLQLLTTNWQPMSRLLTLTRDTSAATALAARMSATIMAAYPQYWPETVRAVVIHSAAWTEAMKEQCSPLASRADKERLLKFCGFGVPQTERALWSLANSLTLVVQDSLQPYDKVGDHYATRDMHVHTLPWPVDVLRELGDTEVEMRVTLSYFVEPNPGRRGWQTRYRYASHGLRFEVKTATETLRQFRARINAAAREEEEGHHSRGDSSDWYLGPDLRSRGSIHSDYWRGTAADLADRGYIGVYPVIGWWRERHQLGRWNRAARYSLLVSLSTAEEAVDLYTPVANQVSITVET